MGLRIKALQKLQMGVDEQKPFTNSSGTFRGEKYIGRDAPSDTGRLPMLYRDRLIEQCKRGYVRYIIYSYGTPIAWVLFGGEWEIPNVKYTLTTTAHQNRVKTATQNFDHYNKLGSR